MKRGGAVGPGVAEGVPVGPGVNVGSGVAVGDGFGVNVGGALGRGEVEGVVSSSPSYAFMLSILVHEKPKVEDLICTFPTFRISPVFSLNVPSV